MNETPKQMFDRAVREGEARVHREAFIRDLTTNPEKFRKEWDAKARAENPALTDLQLQSAWEQVAHQFGL